MAALIPGLAVKVEGRYNDESQVVAESVSFKGNDTKQAESIQAGLHETRVQAQQSKAELEKQNAELVAFSASCVGMRLSKYVISVRVV